MIDYLATTKSVSPGVAASDAEALRLHFPRVVAIEPAFKDYTFNQISFEQRFFPLDDGRTLLRLKRSLDLVGDNNTGMIEVTGWGIKLPFNRAYEIPRQIARRFMTFFAKANAGVLDADEKIEWLRICDQVDVTSFSVDYSAPQYMEGMILKKHPFTVEWHDGTTEILASRNAANFFAFEAGDRFTAFVKAGKKNETVGIDRIMLIPA